MDNENRRDKIELINVINDEDDDYEDDHVKIYNMDEMFEETIHQTCIEILHLIKEYKNDVCLPFAEYVSYDNLYDFMIE